MPTHPAHINDFGCAVVRLSTGIDIAPFVYQIQLVAFDHTVDDFEARSGRADVPVLFITTGKTVRSPQFKIVLHEGRLQDTQWIQQELLRARVTVPYASASDHGANSQFVGTQGRK